MRSFNMVAPAVWQSHRFRALKNDQHRYVLLYLMTNAHQNSSGCYALPEGYACTDLGNWSRKRYRAALDALCEAELILFDEATSEVFILRWFRHNAPSNENHLKGTMRLIQQIKSDRLREAAAAECSSSSSLSSVRRPAALSELHSGTRYR